MKSLNSRTPGHLFTCSISLNKKEEKLLLYSSFLKAQWHMYVNKVAGYSEVVPGGIIVSQFFSQVYTTCKWRKCTYTVYYIAIIKKQLIGKCSSRVLIGLGIMGYETYSTSALLLVEYKMITANLSATPFFGYLPSYIQLAFMQ